MAGGLVQRCVFYRLHQPAANHHGVGHIGHLAGRLAVANAKAHTNGQLDMLANGRHPAGHFADDPDWLRR